MKKLFLIAVTAFLSLNVFSQDYKQNEFQFEVGEALNIYNKCIVGNSKSYYGNVFSQSSPALSLGYYRFATRNIAYGFTAGYTQGNIENSIVSVNGLNESIENYFENSKVFYFAPTFKWAYYNKTSLQMYSGLQAGMSLKNSIVNTGDRMSDKSYKHSSMLFFGQVTAFGISYGEKFYVGCEVGFGYKGLLNLTAGYRF